MDEFSYVEAFLSGTSRLRSLTLRINAKKKLQHTLSQVTNHNGKRTVYRFKFGVAEFSRRSQDAGLTKYYVANRFGGKNEL